MNLEFGFFIVFTRLKDVILDVLFPRFCVNCKEEGRYLCQKCYSLLSEVEFTCPVCGEAEFFGRRHKSCVAKNNPDGCVSFWSYEGLVKQLVLKAKYNSLIDIPKELVDYGLLTTQNNAHRFSEFIIFLFKEETAISYVPLYAKKERERGFNQSKVAAEQLGRRVKKEVVSLLKRERETKSQTQLDKEERFSNTKGAFSFASGERVEQVVLIDDVLTSKATVKECTKVLKQNGVKKVWVLTLTKTS